MNLSFALTLLGWRLGTFDVRLDVDQNSAVAAHPAVDSAVKRISRSWVRRMAS